MSRNPFKGSTTSHSSSRYGTFDSTSVPVHQLTDRGKAPMVQQRVVPSSTVVSENEDFPPLTSGSQRVSSSGAVQVSFVGHNGIGVSSFFSPLDPDLRECTLNTEAALTPVIEQPDLNLRSDFSTPSPSLQVDTSTSPVGHQSKKKKKKKK